MKICKKIAAVVLVFTILMGSILISGALNVPLQAPWLSAAYMHLSTCKFSADGTPGEENQVRFQITYDGDPTNFSHARLTLRLQKRVLGIFWKNVSITATERINEEAITVKNGVWQSENQALHGTFSDVILVGEAGKYRILFTVETFGADGSAEKVERRMEITSVRASVTQPGSEAQTSPDRDDTVEPPTPEQNLPAPPEPVTEIQKNEAEQIFDVKQEDQTLDAEQKVLESEQRPLEYGVLERGDGYVIYDSALFGEITLQCEELVLPADGECVIYDTPIELFREEETGYHLPITGISRDGNTWRFTTNLSEAPFLEISECRLQLLTADRKVTVMFHCDVDENWTPILREDGTVSYLARATDKNGEEAYWKVAEEFEKALGHKVEEGKSYFRVYTVKAPPLHW